jgi:hypothetical protein
MIRSKFALAPMTIALMFAMSCLASSAAAQSCSGCTQSSCPTAGEWSAKGFLEDTPAETGSSTVKENISKASDELSGSTEVPILSVDLKNASAKPNRVVLGRPVKIAAFFEESSSINTSNDSAATNGDKVTAYATIRNSAGTEVDKIDLECISGEEYAGIWNANSAIGVYEATIVASASGASKTFNNALEMAIIPSSKERSGIIKLG